jgi:hypothetical protein
LEVSVAARLTSKLRNGGIERAQREIKDWLACHAPAWAYAGREPLQL